MSFIAYFEISLTCELYFYGAFIIRSYMTMHLFFFPRKFLLLSNATLFLCRISLPQCLEGGVALEGR